MKKVQMFISTNLFPCGIERGFFHNDLEKKLKGFSGDDNWNSFCLFIHRYVKEIDVK